jgi:Peptidase family M50
VRVLYAVPGGNERKSVDIVPRLSQKQQRPMLGVAPPFIPRLISKRLARDLARPVRPNSAADRAEPPFEFGDVIVGVGEPDNPERIEPLPEDPRNPGSGNSDYFAWTHRLRRLAGKEITVQVRRSDGREDKIRLPPAFHVTLPVRMEMGAIAALRVGSAGEKMMLPADPARPMDGDRILAIEVDEPDGSKTIFGQGQLDPLRLPYQLRLWSWRMAKAGKADARIVTLTMHRDKPDANPAGAQIVIRLPWDATWGDQHDMTASADSPLSIPELGVAYYVTSRVVAVDVPPADQAKDVLRPGDIIEAVRFSDRGPRTEVGLHEWAAVFANLQTAPSGEIVAEVLRDGQRHTLVLKAEEDLAWPREERGLILDVDKRVAKADNVLDAAIKGWQQIGTAIGQIWGALSGRVRAQNLGSPVAVIRTSYSIADYDWFLFISLLGSLSLSFCWINLLPIPIVDGGELILLAVEKFTGGPLGPTTRWITYTVGGAFLAAWILCAAAVQQLRFP